MPAPGYATIDDIKDEIINLDFGTNTKLTIARLMRFKSKINGEINSALESGNYQAPAKAVTTTTTSGAETASADTEVIGVSDGSGFLSAFNDAKNTVRIYGLSGTTFNDEFTEMVVVSGNDVTVQALANGYDLGATVESVEEGFKQLRNIESKGTAARALNSPDIRSGNRNEKVDEMQKWYQRCIDQIRKGEMKLDGFTQRTGSLTSWQNDNKSDSDVLTSPVTIISDPF